jgi:hypothetical protein
MVNTKRNRQDRFEDLPLAAREVVAENMKERIYSTITLLAVLATMWQNADHHSPLGTIAGIVGAVAAVWLATLISARMSYRAVHGKAIDRRDYVRTFFTSSGLLAPALPPIFFVTISWLTGWFDLKAALMVSMILSLLSLFAFSFGASRKIYDNVGRQLLISSLELSVGAGIILLKLAVGE